MKTKKLAIPKPPTKVGPRNAGLVIRVRVPRISERRLTGWRFPGARVSGRAKRVTSRLRIAATHSTAKMARQPETRISRLPARGASIGETEITSITSAISRVAWVPVYMSRITARGITITTAPPTP